MEAPAGAAIVWKHYVAVGLCCRRTVGFEVEYAGTLGEGTPDTPNLATVTVNLLVQKPLTSRTHFYIVGGLGAYIESNGSGSAENAYNLGGGLKVGLRPALAFRLDYRLFVFRESPHAAPRSTHPQRIAVGLSLLF
jgi:hypothetical protein